MTQLNETSLLLLFSVLGLGIFVIGFGNVSAQADVTLPVVTVPSNMTVYGEDENGAIVGFNVTAVDDVDGELTPVCNPASFSLFPIGNNTVFCSAQDLSGNIGNGTFSVKVLIPQWVKIKAGDWCVGEVDDLTFAKVIQFLIYAEVIDRPGVWGQESVLGVPDWAKQNGCWWEADLISDEEFINVILYLIDEGIIIVS